ncbi:MAG: hypothetical protein J2P55_00245 [Rhizobiales bacterium]|nr:hypothetical protein [Hyphomicrobiales bacterium]
MNSLLLARRSDDLAPYAPRSSIVSLERCVPSSWSGPYCGWRLVEAFRILLMMPMRFGPMLWGSTWPPYRHEWADLLAQYEAAQEDIEKTARAQNRVRLHPSAADIGFMDATIVWPARYLRDRPVTARAVGRVAVLRARGLDFDQIARRMRRSTLRLRAVNRSGLDAIALGLNRDRVPVF